jgi:hypothetical protein
VPEKPRGPARRSGNGIRDEVLRHNLPATASGNQRLACRLQSVCLTRRCDKQQCRTSLTEQPTSGLCSTDKSVRYDRRCQRSYVLSFHGLCSPSRSLDSRFACASPYRYGNSSVVLRQGGAGALRNPSLGARPGRNLFCRLGAGRNPRPLRPAYRRIGGWCLKESVRKTRLRFACPWPAAEATVCEPAHR